MGVDVWIFDENYREQLRHRGCDLSIQALGWRHRDEWRAGLQQLSPEAQMRRFRTTQVRFGRQLENYLLKPDFVHHVALGVAARVDGEWKGIAVGRLIRLDESSAEVAVTVLDSWQRKGIGSVLVTRLAKAASERGITQLLGHTSPDNTAVQRMVKRVGSQVTWDFSEPTSPSFSFPLRQSVA